MPIPEIARELSGSDNFLVTAHIHPDGDAIGSLIGMNSLLSALGKRAVAVCHHPVPERYRFLPGSDDIAGPVEAKNMGPFEAAVILDAGEYGRIGDVAELIDDSTRLINIDHHLSNDGFGDAAWVDPGASAVSEMLYALFGHFKVLPDEPTALALYVGILTDTGRFRFPNTSSLALATVAALVERGADPSLATEKVYYDTEESVLRGLGNVITRVERNGEDGKVATTHMTLDENSVDSEGFIDYILAIRGVEVAALMRETKPGFFKISLRSEGAVDVAEIAGRFGGGGHRNAAGCRIEGDLAAVKNEVVTACTTALKNDGSSEGTRAPGS